MSETNPPSPPNNPSGINWNAILYNMAGIIALAIATQVTIGIKELGRIIKREWEYRILNETDLTGRWKVRIADRAMAYYQIVRDTSDHSKFNMVVTQDNNPFPTLPNNYGSGYFISKDSAVVSLTKYTMVDQQSCVMELNLLWKLPDRHTIIEKTMPKSINEEQCKQKPEAITKSASLTINKM